MEINGLIATDTGTASPVPLEQFSMKELWRYIKRCRKAYGRQNNTEAYDNFLSEEIDRAMKVYNRKYDEHHAAINKQHFDRGANRGKWKFREKMRELMASGVTRKEAKIIFSRRNSIIVDEGAGNGEQ